MSPTTRTTLAALALLAAGAGAGRLLAEDAPLARADAREGGRASMEVINYTKTNEPIVFIYDEASHRLLAYTTVSGSDGFELKVAAIRDIEYDERVQEYKNRLEKGMSVREIKRAVEDEEAKEREAAKKAADKEKKDKAAEDKKAGDDKKNG